MKIVYIANLNLHVKGGLFKATFERIARMNERVDSTFIINNNFYDSFVMNKIKTLFKLKDDRLKKPEKNHYKNIEINNTNYKRTVLFYIKRLLHLQSTENGMIEHYLKTYKSELEQADLIHAHFGWVNGYIAYKLSQRLNKPYFVTLHGSDVNKVWKHNVSRLVEAMENAETCFFVSEQLLEQAKALGYSGRNSLITYNGVDTSLFVKPETPKNNRVGFIGSLKEIKGADLLPDIFSKIHQHNEDVKFTVIGDGKLRTDLEKSFEQSDLNFEMLGLVDYDEVPAILKTIDVLIVPSRNEGLGMVILEANAMGIPVVGANVGGIPEAIGFEENIIDFDDDMTEKMAQRVNELLTDKTETSRYRERVLQKFDWNDIVALEKSRYDKLKVDHLENQ